MKIFQCTNCLSPIYFENIFCESCGYNLGYLSEQQAMIAAAAQNNGHFITYDHQRFQYCQNQPYGVCNWLVPQSSGVQFCDACKLNRTIPNLSNTHHYQAWKNIEQAKHSVIYNIQCLNLPLQSKEEAPDQGLAFEFLADSNNDPEKSVQTGHFEGTITINLDEADSVHRELTRKQMFEPYRTLIGHFRHELGHYYWTHLMGLTADSLVQFRELFGDERKDYGTALDEYYKSGINQNWREHFISSYATSHPWEDWAETWAHYLHIMDTLESAFAFGLTTDPQLHGVPTMSMKSEFNPYLQADFSAVIEAFLPLTFAINSINRSMGLSDIYPFTLSSTVIKKLNFIHYLVKSIR